MLEQITAVELVDDRIAVDLVAGHERVPRAAS
jgi:hypothetical protein